MIAPATPTGSRRSLRMNPSCSWDSVGSISTLLSSTATQPGVEIEIQEVVNQAHEDAEEREEEDQILDHRVVPLLDGHENQGTETWYRKVRINHQGAAEKAAGLDPHHSHNRDQGVSQC